MYLAPIKSLRCTNTQTNRQTDKQTNKLYSINSIGLGPLARRLIAQQWLRWGGIPVGQLFDSRDSRGTFGLQSGLPWEDWSCSFIVKYRLSAPTLVIYRLTLKRFLAVKESSYVKFEHIYIPREKSELSEYLIRFRIAHIVFEIFPFKERSFFSKIRHFSLVFRTNDQLNSAQYSQKSNRICQRMWWTFI